MTATSPRTGFPWLLMLFALPALGVLLALGTWQVQRLAWKENLLATIEARISAAPVPLADVIARQQAAEPVEYTPVTVTGTFDHAGEQFFFATHKGISGFYVYTPMTLAEPQGSLLFVNRGFVPYDLKDRAARPESLPQGVQTVTGLARETLAEKPGFLVPDNDPPANIYYWKDLEAMRTAAGLDRAAVLPLFVDAGLPQKEYPLGDWPVPGVTIINLPNNHLQYAVTWYGLALALVAVTGVYLRRRMRPGA